MKLRMPDPIQLSESIELLQDVSFDDVTPYDKNYLKHEKNREHIKNSIGDFKYDTPIVVDKNMVIVKGHGRYEALKMLKFEKIPFIHRNNFLDTKKKASASRIADNESAKAAEVDFDLLGIEIGDIGDSFDMGDYGFDLDMLGADEEEEEEEEKEKDKKAIECPECGHLF